MKQHKIITHDIISNDIIKNDVSGGVDRSTNFTITVGKTSNNAFYGFYVQSRGFALGDFGSVSPTSIKVPSGKTVTTPNVISDISTGAIIVQNLAADLPSDLFSSISANGVTLFVSDATYVTSDPSKPFFNFILSGNLDRKFLGGAPNEAGFDRPVVGTKVEVVIA